MPNLSRPTLSIIVAMAENRVIGKDNQLPWHLPADLHYFKTTTTGHPVIMGRKTYASIGKPLPNRLNIIITRDQTFHAPNCLVAHSLENALHHPSLKENQTVDTSECFIIGGAEIYQQALPHTHQIYMTLVHQHFAGDTYFPELNADEWTKTNQETHQADQTNPFAYSFLRWKRTDHYHL